MTIRSDNRQLADPDAPGDYPIHRLRDLDGRQRLLCLAFIVVLLLPPVIAFARAAPVWTASGDPALMAVRALDVGTSRTPLLGQPSTSGHYVDAADHVHHLGATHFYLMAGPVRLLGPSLGMLVVSVFITAGCVLIAAWTVFRQLGPRIAILGAALLSLVMFTTGAASLINPISSNIAGYPLLCSVVLLWALVCGDLRLLPLAAAMASFTAQQHLSVVAAVGIASAAGIVGFLLIGRRERGWGAPEARRRDLRWLALGVASALVVWSPVLYEQVTNDPGNLQELADFAANNDRPTVGAAVGLRQVAHALGLPPILGHIELDGGDFIGEVTIGTWISAGAVLVVLALLGWRWRRAAPRRAALVVMVAGVAVAGFVNGSSVIDGFERFRVAFYHWTFPLAMLVALALGLGAVDLLRWLRPRWSLLSSPLLCALGLLAAAAPAVIDPTLDRRSNTMEKAISHVDRSMVEELVDQVLAGRSELPGPTVVLPRNETLFSGIRLAVAVELIDRGLPVVFPAHERNFVDGERVVDRSTVGGGLLVVMNEPPRQIEGRLIADVAADGFDVAAYDALVAQALGAGDYTLSAEGAAEIGAENPNFLDYWNAIVGILHNSPLELVQNPNALGFLLQFPDYSPLDPELIERYLDSWPEDSLTYRIRVYEVSRDELLDIANDTEIP